MIATRPNAKPCQHCGTEFTPRMPLQRVCGPLCASRLVRRAKKEQAESTRKRKEAIKTIPQLIKEAQVCFNAFIRERDRQAGHACISSGRALDWSGNGVDAGHYRSTGAASHLRFNEDNCHAQSKMDNQYLSGNAVDYRIGLITRIGLDRVEALESNNTVNKWTADGLRAIKAEYRAKLKQLREANE
jgi:hypothetical protein